MNLSSVSSPFELALSPADSNDDIMLRIRNTNDQDAPRIVALAKANEHMLKRFFPDVLARHGSVRQSEDAIMRGRAATEGAGFNIELVPPHEEETPQIIGRLSVIRCKVMCAANRQKGKPTKAYAGINVSHWLDEQYSQPEIGAAVVENIIECLRHDREFGPGRLFQKILPPQKFFTLIAPGNDYAQAVAERVGMQPQGEPATYGLEDLLTPYVGHTLWTKEMGLPSQ